VSSGFEKVLGSEPAYRRWVQSSGFGVLSSEFSSPPPVGGFGRGFRACLPEVGSEFSPSLTISGIEWELRWLPQGIYGSGGFVKMVTESKPASRSEFLGSGMRN